MQKGKSYNSGSNQDYSKTPNFLCQPFNNISNIRETEQEDDYSLEYI